MDILMDSVKVLGRIVTILPLMLVIGLYMGKRSIGELPVFDFLVVLVFGAVVGADIADPKINHIHTIVAMVAIAFLHQLIIFMKLKNRKIGKLLSFEPTVVIYNGKFLYKNIKKINYAIDNITQMLRGKGVFTIQDVEIAVIEANGQLSVKLKAEKEWATKVEVGGKITPGEYDVPIILDGVAQEKMLKRMGRDKEWMKDQLNKHSIFDIQTVFYGALTPAGKFIYSTKDEQEDLSMVPPIEH